MSKDHVMRSYGITLGGDTETRQCFCVGPQRGEPVCPCRMGRVKQVNGRWIETIDHGPVGLATDPKVAKALEEYLSPSRLAPEPE